MLGGRVEVRLWITMELRHTHGAHIIMHKLYVQVHVWRESVPVEYLAFA